MDGPHFKNYKDFQHECVVRGDSKYLAIAAASIIAKTYRDELMFKLHEKLDEDCLLVGQFDLSLLLISRDANYPWLILVPKRENITEIYQLNDIDRQQLLHESCVLSQVMTELFAPDKLNIAALGNVVPQLHIHHIGLIYLYF